MLLIEGVCIWLLVRSNRGAKKQAILCYRKKQATKELDAVRGASAAGTLAKRNRTHYPRV